MATTFDAKTSALNTSAADITVKLDQMYKSTKITQDMLVDAKMPVVGKYVTDSTYSYYDNIGNSCVTIDSSFQSLSKKIDEVTKMLEEKKTKEKEEKKNMTTQMSFGPVKNGSGVKLSLYGIAYKVNNDYISFDPDTKESINVTGMTMEPNGLLYMLPIALEDVKPGMTIITDNDIIVVAEHASDNPNSIYGFSFLQRAFNVFYPPKSMIGFNYVTRVVNLMDESLDDMGMDNFALMMAMSNGNAATNTLNNNMLPFIMMAKKDKHIDPMMLMMMNGNMDNNTMVMMAMMDKKRRTKENGTTDK